MLTPARYWRIAKPLAELEESPARELELPESIAQQIAPPKEGDGVLLADYDSDEQTGIVRHIGIVKRCIAQGVEVDWMPVCAEIWVDTPSGRGNWSTKPGFRFADAKVSGYGLHQLFAGVFPGLEAREQLPNGARSVRQPRAANPRRPNVPRERLQPIEVVGQPTTAPRGGYVYVLESAYGYKVGRTKNMPNRMRAFGVKLPIMYTIPLCAWFDDHFEAEASYHRLFADKHINGEWFNLQEQDVAMIRAREFG